MVEIKQLIIPATKINRPCFANSMKYITIHNTDNTVKGANAKTNATYVYNGAGGSKTSWHYTVDDTSIYQSLPDNEGGYHTGDGTSPSSGNRNSIGIEICVNSDGDILKATDNAVELTAMLCKKHNIPLSNVVQHNKWSGKNCPSFIRKGVPYDWDEFIRKVGDKMNRQNKKLESGNDIVWELMNGEYKIEISEVDRAVKALDKAKYDAEFCSLYWMFYKLVNK